MKQESRSILRLGVIPYAFSAALCGLSQAGDRSPAQSRVIMTEFAKVAHVNAIPSPVLTALAPLLGGKRLVDPAYLDKATNMWKPTTDDRLLFAAKSPTLWLVHYEQQAPTPTRHVAIIELKGDDSAMLLEHLLMKEQAFSVPALKHIIEKGLFKTMAAGEATEGGK